MIEKTRPQRLFAKMSREEIVRWKTGIREFLCSSHSEQSMNDTHTGLSVTLTHQNAWSVLEELIREQRRRWNGSSTK